MKNKQILFTAKNTAELVPCDLPAPQPNEIVVRTAVTTVSNGTERANVTGDPNVSITSGGEVSFPRACGYSASGTVVAVGAAVTTHAVGDRVALYGSHHKAYNVLPAARAFRIPDGVSFAAASMSYIAIFPMAAIRKTRVEMGESALVMGLGTLGLIAVSLLRTAGACPIVAADPTPARRALALTAGADYALDPTAPDFAEQVKAITDGGARVAIEVTGVGAGLNGALDCMARFGRVALLGCTRSSDFTVDYYRKVHGPGITLIGAHTMARPANDSAPGWFTTADDMRAVLTLMEMGRLDLDRLICERATPEECPAVYRRLAEGTDFPAVMQFVWENDV